MAAYTKAELERKISQTVAQMKAMNDSDTDETPMSQEDGETYADFEKTLDELKARLSRRMKVEQDAAESANTTDDSQLDSDKSYIGATVKTVSATAKKAEKKDGSNALQFVIAKAYDTLPSDISKTWKNSNEMLRQNFGESAVTKALAATTATGSAAIPQAFLAELVEYLRANVAVRKMNPRVIPMGEGNLRIPRQSGATTAYWQNEQADLTYSAATMDQIVLNAVRLTAMSDITNELIARSPIAVADMIQRDLSAQVERAEDIAFIRSTAAPSPIGLLGLAPAGSKIVAPALTGNSATDTQLVLTFLSKLRNKLDAANVPMRNPGWLMSPVVRNYILSLRNSLGYPYFSELADSKTLLGYPVETTTQIPLNLTTGGGTNGSEIYFVDFSEVIIGETMAPTLEMDRTAAYIGAGGTLISAWSQNLTVFRLITAVDFNINHPLSVAVGFVDNWVL